MMHETDATRLAVHAPLDKHLWLVEAGVNSYAVRGSTVGEHNAKALPNSYAQYVQAPCT